MTDLDTLCENCGHKNSMHYGGLAFNNNRCVKCQTDFHQGESEQRCMKFVPPAPPMVLNPCQNCGHEWSLHRFSEDGKQLLTCNPHKPTPNSVAHCACALFVSKWGGEPIPKDPNYFPRPEEEDEIQ